MFEQNMDKELEQVRETISSFYDEFRESIYYNKLDDASLEETRLILESFSDFMYTHHGQTPEQWDADGLEECCLATLPSKVSADDNFFISIPPVLSAFFEFSHEKGYLRIPLYMAERVNSIGRQILKNSKDRDKWSPSKEVAMAAKEAGIDFHDRSEVEKFINDYNLSHRREDLYDDELDMDYEEDEDDIEYLSDTFLDRLFSRRWREDKIKDMSTEEILEQLKSLDIHIDESTFKDQAGDHISAIKLAQEHFLADNDDIEGTDYDFVMFASMELWSRFLPEKHNIEMIDDRVETGYSSILEDRMSDTISHWERAWDMLKNILTDDVKSIDGVEDLFSGDSAKLYSIWCQEFDMVLFKLGREDDEYLRKRIVFADEFVRLLADLDEDMLRYMQHVQAESYLYLGEVAKADEKYDELIARYPDFLPLYLHRGDLTAGFVKCDKISADLDKAESIYRLGLANSDEDDEGREQIYYRLRDLRKIRKRKAR